MSFKYSSTSSRLWFRASSFIKLNKNNRTVLEDATNTKSHGKPEAACAVVEGS
jgi:hypothetical protein